jgi:SAM-dependent methyltransferase
MIVEQTDTINTVAASPASHAVTLLCWQCCAELADLMRETRTGSGVRVCPRCAAQTEYRQGIWCALAPKRIDRFGNFIREYEFIRAAEGRGSIRSEYYLSLPYKDISGRNNGQWRIRAHTFQVMEQRILKPLARLHNRPLRVLDLGAGNSWMSYRLALKGHLPVAVDLLTNDRDGLGAAIHYNSTIQSLFPRVQAELDWLPFPSCAFDLVIFNASFHYSEDYERTFAEAVRCTRPGGSVVIADTPWYAEDESGKRMVEEKHTHFKTTYGFASDSISSLEYLTPERLQRLQDALELKWEIIKPFYGIRWSQRPLRAWLKGRRPPSQFRIYVAGVRA